MSRVLLFLVGWAFAATGLLAAERIPAPPARYFNDYAGIVRPATADALNRQLEQFERDTSNQLLVAIYPKMESDSSVEDYTVRVAQAWKAGQKGKDNGAVLFAFMQSHDLYLQVGYGLEGAIPDVTAKRIITQEIVPRFRAGDMDGGMTAAVQAMMAAAKGEYQGTGATQAERGRSSGSPGVGLIIGVILVLFVLRTIFGSRRSVVIGGRGRRFVVIPSSSWGGSSDRGGWGGGSSGGGFSGGGGSFGGGGAGGKW